MTLMITAVTHQGVARAAVGTDPVLIEGQSSRISTEIKEIAAAPVTKVTAVLENGMRVIYNRTPPLSGADPVVEPENDSEVSYKEEATVVALDKVFVDNEPTPLVTEVASVRTSKPGFFKPLWTNDAAEQNVVGVKTE